jgi:hypothetical protein
MIFPLQAFCSSITGTLATMAVLKGVGVGDSSATPLAATLTWMLKGIIYYTETITTTHTYIASCYIRFLDHLCACTNIP